MRSFLRVGATMFALLVAANVAVAQDGGARGGGGGGGGGGRGGAGMATRLLTDITLTAEQNTKKDDVVKWYDEELAKLPNIGRGAEVDSTTRAKVMADRTKLQGEFRDKLKALLTAEQQKKFDENVAAMPAGGRGRGRGQ